MNRTIDTVVYHHSGTSRDLDPKKSVASFDRTHKARLHLKPNKLWYHIAYHYLVFSSWEVLQTRPDDEVWYHAGTNEGNWKTMNSRSIWVCVVWSFDTEKPTEEQYEACRKLLLTLEEKYGKLNVLWHRDVDGVHKTCPWTNFDLSLISSPMPREKMIMIALAWMSLSSNLYDILPHLIEDDQAVASIRDSLSSGVDTLEEFGINHRDNPVFGK